MKKRFHLFLYIILISLSMVFYISCENATNEAPSNNSTVPSNNDTTQPSNNNSTEIEIVSLPQKMNYLINETLDLKGLEIHKKIILVP